MRGTVYVVSTFTVYQILGSRPCFLYVNYHIFTDMWATEELFSGEWSPCSTQLDHKQKLFHQSYQSYPRKTWAYEVKTHWNSRGFRGVFNVVDATTVRFCIATKRAEKPNGSTELSFKDIGVLPEGMAHDSDDVMMLWHWLTFPCGGGIGR